jgi:alpha-1,6-mannosyltransferase
MNPPASRIRICDLTLAYTSTSGGIRTYIDRKRDYIKANTDHEHLLVIPGEEDDLTQDGRLTTVQIASPLIPGSNHYRFFWRPEPVRRALSNFQPDIVELGSFFVSPWAAFDYRRERENDGRQCLVSGYFHTDLAGAYVGTPLRQALAETIRDFSDTLAGWGEQLSGIFEKSAEEHFGAIFRRCDLTLAATRAQAERLAEYGVSGTEIVPLGVDLSFFHPRRRSQTRRQELGVAENESLLIYAGRLDSEKQVDVIADAFAKLGEPSVKLVLMGAGPEKGELERRAQSLSGMQVLPFEADKERFANILASADIYVTAGPHETFGLSVVEAQASGLPVVGVNAGALRERVASDVGRLGPVGDAAAMAENIEEVLAERKTLGEAARRHVEKAGYDWDSSFKKLIGLYEEHLGAELTSE